MMVIRGELECDPVMRMGQGEVLVPHDDHM